MRFKAEAALKRNKQLSQQAAQVWAAAANQHHTNHHDEQAAIAFADSVVSHNQPITIHAYLEGDARYETFEGKKHLVVPVIALKEGVVNGLFVPGEELQWAHAWNGVPVPIGHPEVNGMPVSANSPQLLEKHNVGRMFNARFEDNALKGELWIDVLKAEALGQHALIKRLQNGTPVEVSTAYWSEDDFTSGNFNGREYYAVSRKLRPDHLAVLPNEQGACSWADGCGTPRVHHDQGSGNGAIAKALGVLAAAVGINLNGNSEETNMGKEQLIKLLVNSKNTNWTKDDKETLEAMDEGVLAKMLPVEEPEGQHANSAGDGKEGPKGDGKQEPEGAQPNANGTKTDGDNGAGGAGHKANGEGQPQDLDAYLATLPEPVRATVQSAMKAQADRKAKLVDGLDKNEACKFNKDRLNAMALEDLEVLAESFATAAPTGTDYSGRDGAPHGNQGGDDAPEAPPSVLLATNEKGG